MPTPDEQPGTTEPGDAGADHVVPPDLLELHQVLEWNEAVEQER